MRDEEIKYCPFRVVTETFPAMCVGNGDITRTSFEACLKEQCPAFYVLVFQMQSVYRCQIAQKVARKFYVLLWRFMIAFDCLCVYNTGVKQKSFKNCQGNHLKYCPVLRRILSCLPKNVLL